MERKSKFSDRIYEKSFDVPIYGGKAIVSIGLDGLKASDKYKIPFPEADSRFNLGFVWGHTDTKGKRRYIIWFPSEPEPHVVFHEVTHLVNWIFADVGIKLDVNNDEFQTYFGDFLFKEVNNKIQKIVNEEN